VVPSNKRWYRNLVISSVVADTLKAMKLEYPTPSADVDWQNLRVE
jgi:hypothetical protein